MYSQHEANESKKSFKSFNHNKIDTKKENEPKSIITEPYSNMNINSEISYSTKKDNDDEISKLLEDTVGFNKCKKN